MKNWRCVDMLMFYGTCLFEDQVLQVTKIAINIHIVYWLLSCTSFFVDTLLINVIQIPDIGGTGIIYEIK